MGEVLKELGKFLYNFALIIGGAGIVKPLFEEKYSLKGLFLGFLIFLLLVSVGSALIYLGNKLENSED